jgi:hypothetical protein
MILRHEDAASDKTQRLDRQSRIGPITGGTPTENCF